MQRARLVQLAVLIAFTTFCDHDALAQNPRPAATVTNTILQPPAPTIGNPPTLNSFRNNPVPDDVSNYVMPPSYGVGGFYQRGRVSTGHIIRTTEMYIGVGLTELTPV